MENKKSFISIINAISDGLEKIINVCVVVFVAALGISVFTGVLGRNINIPVVWLDEVSTYCCIWATFFGFALACKHGMLSNVDVLVHWLPDVMRKYFEIFWIVFGCVFMGIVLWSCRDYLSYVFHANTLSAQLRVPLVYIYMGPVLGYIFALFFGVVNVINKIVDNQKGEG